ncbi:aryl-sulfate sulfotransferase [bacterium]|nr:aryl-sulfate sulfotransferase [bacterium]
MRNSIKYIIVITLFALLYPCNNINADTLGLTYYDTLQSFEGYTLFAPISWNVAYLINNEGNLVHSWDCERSPGQSVYLLEDGNLLYTTVPDFVNPVFSGGGSAGRVQIIDWDGTVTWNYTFSTVNYHSHHDAEYLPWGNVLLVAWEYKSYGECIAAGRVPAILPDSSLWPDMIVEIIPTGATTGEIVWAWHSWDHLVQDFDSTRENYGIIAANPGRLNINYIRTGPGSDWLHVNAVDYNPGLDQIVISAHNFGEFWVIDHSTADYDDPEAGMAAAAGPAGDILYRWGNPRAYNRGAPPDQYLFGQHDAQWIEPGLPGESNFLVFNNGMNRIPPAPFSSVDEIIPPVDSLGNYTLIPGSPYEPSEPYWTYTADPLIDFYSSNISGCQRLLNGNTLICEGANGRLFEVTSEGDLVWEYINPVDQRGPRRQGTTVDRSDIFRCYRYAPDYPGLEGRDLTPVGPIELPESTGISEKIIPDKFAISCYPNPFNGAISIEIALGSFSNNSDNLELEKLHALYNLGVKIFDINGREIRGMDNCMDGWVEISGSPNQSLGLVHNRITWQPSPSTPSGIYLIRLHLENTTVQRRVIYLK